MARRIGRLAKELHSGSGCLPVYNEQAVQGAFGPRATADIYIGCSALRLFEDNPALALRRPLTPVDASLQRHSPGGRAYA